MKYFELIVEECNRLNDVMENHFDGDTIYFISAGLSEIKYGLANDCLIYCYEPGKYDPGKTMILNEVMIRLLHDSNREYSTRQAVSFLENECKSFINNYDVLPLDLNLINIKRFFELSANNADWEKKYITYLKSIATPW